MKRLNQLILAALAVVLTACSGGAPTTQNPNTTDPTVAGYGGPAPASADVQAFKINLWDNIKGANRCGNCHKEGGQSPMFARGDDVNLAYHDALQVVDLAQPDQSRMVTKVAGGHNCWLASAQSCADILTTWIKNWAGGSGAASGTQIELTAPPDKDVGATKTFPADPALFGSTIYPLLTQFCSRCHSSSAATPQAPFFASGDLAEAYAAAQAKINLDTPVLSRFYLRLHEESHNCWAIPAGGATDCPGSSQRMLDAIQAFADGIAPTQVDPSLIVSKALAMYDGVVAAGQNRYDTGIIAKYTFKEGSGAVADDTSGVDPAANLTIEGDVNWVGGWGLAFGANGGKAQATVGASSKLYNKIKETGEYSLELWAAPANVVQEDVYLVSYGSGTTTKNFTLGQHEYQYQAFARSSATDTNGAPALVTADADRDAQASLQHVVLVYDPVNGRRLYVNGNYTGDVDAAKGGTLSNWDDTLAFVLGNSTAGNAKWAGVIRFAAVYNKALTLDQVQQNFAAGVGERYFLLFNVSSLSGMAQSYVMFEVSRYDSYSYLFSKPVFISLDASATPGDIPIKGMRIGINGSEARVGQAYARLNTSVSNTNYIAGKGQLLSQVGTVIPLEKGPDNDLFFLTFEQIGTHTNVRTEGAVPAPATPPDAAPVPDVGARNFSEINASMASVTGVATTDANVRTTYMTVQQQLPSLYDLNALLASHQVGVAQLAIQYCDSLVESGQAASFFPGLNLGAAAGSYFASDANKALVVDPLIGKAVGTSLATQPTDSELRTELYSLIGNLATSCGAGCPADRTKTITKAACAAVIGSGALLLK
ncbi:MAG: LamG domain-containing protein [Steroidobacteraceae bacterium]